MSKREPIVFLLLTAVLALTGLGLYCLAGSREKEAGPMPDVLIITATDLHYISPALTDHGAEFQATITNSDGKVMECIEELTDAFLGEVLQRRPDALILSGDLTFNGARQSHADLAAKLEAVTAAGIPVLVIPGNHDLENRNAAQFHGDGFTRVASVSPEDFGEIYTACGYGGALSRDSASLSYIYELSPDLRILFIDVNMPDSKNRVKPETLLWAEEQLRAAAEAGARVVAVSHQNLYRHNSVIYESYVIENAGELLALYGKYGVLCNLSGHLHCQHIAQGENGFLDIATASLAVSPNQYGLLILTPERGSYETAPTDVSAWASARGLKDPKLLDFAAYSRDFFRHSGRDQSPDNYGVGPEGQAMAGFIADVNQAYFAGRMDTIDLNDPRFDRLLAEGGFMGLYLASTREDGPMDMNHAEIY